MVNVDKLRGKIVEHRLSPDDMAKILGISKNTYYRRINDGGGSFTINEAGQIAKTLQLTADEFNAIFFENGVA